MMTKRPRLTEPPRWVCLNDADRDRFEAWTNARLDELTGPRGADIRREQVLDPKFAAAVEQEVSERLKRGRVILAARAQDVEALARLADTAELRRLAFRRHGRGREKGEERPRDLPQLLKFALELAVDDVSLIRKIWLQHHQRRNRTMDPTAVAIAARRNGIKNPETLINFMKNRHRRS